MRRLDVGAWRREDVQLYLTRHLALRIKGSHETARALGRGASMVTENRPRASVTPEPSNPPASSLISTLLPASAVPETLAPLSWVAVSGDTVTVGEGLAGMGEAFGGRN
ncbi:hypothetical protein QWZ10_06325 [Paracoccus cavernae]|uniref:Uncharacterized protein n=1 Tax=Paracoccus cavernae TaxID=1571207 RepID=A0ABT8D445_9RHOB|nr:hypothetical protein [Paracoccus cavernae]